MTDAVKGRLLLVCLCLAWGLTWPAMRIALEDIPPFSMRLISSCLGAASMFALAALAGRPIGIPERGKRGYIFIVAFFNMIVFSVCAAFAQLSTMTGRVAILVYTMPIWTGLLSWFFLGERLNVARTVALLLCIAGMSILIAPLASVGVPIGVVLALCAAWSWAIGTIYIKKSRIVVEPFTLTAWQLFATFIVMAVLAAFFDRSFDITAVGWKAWLGVIFTGLLGAALSYWLWFRIIRMMPATTASLGALASPVIGLVSSIFLLGEIPTMADSIGFALIFAASACALLQPQGPASPKSDS